MTEAERCRREIASAERAIRAGEEPLVNLCLWLNDWACELRVIEEEKNG